MLDPLNPFHIWQNQTLTFKSADVNYKAVYFGKICAPHMLKVGGGIIINVSSGQPYRQERDGATIVLARRQL